MKHMEAICVFVLAPLWMPAFVIGLIVGHVWVGLSGGFILAQEKDWEKLP